MKKNIGWFYGLQFVKPIFIKLINTVWKFTWNPTNVTNTFSMIWIYPVMIMQNNSIASPIFKHYAETG